jgi:hypothetical protein
MPVNERDQWHVDLVLTCIGRYLEQIVEPAKIGILVIIPVERAIPPVNDGHREVVARPAEFV